MRLKHSYPTPEHARAAEAISEHFAADFAIDAVLLTNSCARGKATPDSCLDIAILARPERLAAPLSTLEADWAQFEQASPAIAALAKVGKYSVVHPNFGIVPHLT